MNNSKNNTPSNSNYHLFGKTSKLIFIAACILIAVGFLLMSGPGTTFQAFHPGIFSVRRIVIAPTLCLAGYLLIIIGILHRDS